MRPRTTLRFATAQVRCAMALCAVALPAAAAPVHGGAYLPVPSTPAAPTGPGPSAGAPGPATGGGAAGAAAAATGAGLSRASWEDWWRFNRDPYLDLRRAIGYGSPATGADEIVSGERHGSLPGRAVVRDRIVPELRSLLESERSNEIATGAMIALARSGEDPDGATAALLGGRLADSNQEVAETAALSLGILGGEGSIPDLVALLEDSERGRELAGGKGRTQVPLRTRAFAAFAIGLAAHQAPNARTRQIAARALCAAIDAPPTASQDLEVAAVLALSMAPLPVEREESSSAPWISLQTEIRFLAGLLEERGRRPLVRAHAVTALARLAQGAPEELRAEIVGDLLRLVRARGKLENEVLQSVAQALGLLGTADGDVLDREVRGALDVLLGDADVQTRAFAYMSLAEAGSRDGPDDGEEEGATACRNLITAEVLRGRGLTRPWAAIALGVLERRILDGGGGGLETSRTSRENLRRYFASARQRSHLGAAAIGLGLCRDERAVPMLRQRLRDLSEDQGQGYVALALGMIGAREAIPDLVEIARASKYRPALLEDVAIGLALLGHRDAATDLADLLAKAQGLSAQASYASALGRIGDERVVETLVGMLHRKEITSGARAFAAAALGQVADPADLPWYAPISVDLNYQARTPTLLGGDGRGILEIL